MKKLKLVSVLFSLMMLISISFASNAAVVAVPIDADFKCKVEIIDCPGWGTGDRQICHQNGTGVDCRCGSSTNCGDKVAIEDPVAVPV